MFSLLDSLFNKDNLKIKITTEEIKTAKIENKPFTKEDSWNELMDLEASVRKNPTVDGYYSLGLSYINYCAHHIRGLPENKKPYWDKAAGFLEIAFNLAKETLPVISTDKFAPLSQIVIAEDLGILLVRNYSDEENIRKGMKYLDFMRKSTDQYYPGISMMSLGYCKLKEYDNAFKLIEELKERVNKSDEWRGVIDPDYSRFDIYRMFRDKEYKNMNYKESLKYSNLIVNSKYSRDDDAKRHKTIQNKIDKLTLGVNNKK